MVYDRWNHDDRRGLGRWHIASMEFIIRLLLFSMCQFNSIFLAFYNVLKKVLCGGHILKRIVLAYAEEWDKQLIPVSKVEHVRLKKTMDVVYVADVLFDEIAFIALHNTIMSDDKPSKVVCVFFSCFNQFAFAFNSSRKVKRIMHSLDDIARIIMNLALHKFVGLWLRGGKRTIILWKNWNK